MMGGENMPEEALREALLNALVHRAYSFSGSIIINVNDERMEFISIGGLLPGLFLIPLSCAGGRYIGGGDALGFLVCGTYIGFAGTFELMLLSFTMAGIWGLFLLKIRKESRNSGFPLFPFILAAQGMRLLLVLARNI